LETDYNAGKKPRDKIGHHTIATALGVMEEPEDPSLHMRKLHRTITTSLVTMVEPGDPDLHMTKNYHGANSPRHDGGGQRSRSP
jgi:hypothetical protein